MNGVDVYNDLKLDCYLSQSDDPECYLCGGETTYEQHNELDYGYYICNDCISKTGWCEDEG